MKLADAATDLFGEISPPVAGVGDDAFFSNFMTAGIRIFFVVAGLAATIYMLWGAFDWIISSGDKERLSKAQAKIRNAIIGLLMVVIVLSIIVVIERVVFDCRVCFGISCGIKIPTIDSAASTVSSCADLP